MNKVFLLFSFSFFFLYSAFGQGGTWTWISGDSAANSLGVYGTQGVPSVNNHPPGMYEPSEWKDKQGNFWVYGGYDYPDVYSDLWKYNPLTNEWTWVKGEGIVNMWPVWGLKGTSNASNTPGARGFAATSWVDTAGNLWLFGGQGLQTNPFNDLWKYDISTNNWTWISGSNGVNAIGVHGTQGVASSSNVPGARWETCSAWTDSINNLWLFGGTGHDDNGVEGFLNDFCKFDIAANEWTWMKGSSLANAPSNYGIKGISNSNNDPGARDTYTKWKDLNDSYWIMGGYTYISPYECASDVWKYDKLLNEWTWMEGPNVLYDTGTYRYTCIYDTLNMPRSRMEQRSSVTDNCGRFWMFGGAYSPFSGYLNDLWVFDPQQLKWEWLSGTNVSGEQSNYGMLGVPASLNVPSSRRGALSWWGNDNKFYLFGGTDNSSFLTTYSDLWVFNPDTNCVPSSCGAVAVVPPITNFQSSKTTLCANDCINFTDLSINATSWQWSFAGATDSTSVAQNPQSVCYVTAGIYNVTLIASNSGGSDTVTFNNYIHVVPVPPTPVITQHQDHDTLYCSTDTSYTSYQWSYDSTVIAGATDTSLVISKNGNYNVQVTNGNGCKIAVGINVIIGIQNYMSDHFVSLSPNPVGGKFTVYGLWFTVSQVEIYNVLGQEASPPASLPRRGESAVIDVSGLPAGLYFVQVIGEKERWVGKFVKE